MSPPPPASTPHLLDLSPSDTLPDHDPLPPTILNSALRPSGGAGSAATATAAAAAGPSLPKQQDNDKAEESSERGYPDRSSYQQLPDTPGTPPIENPFDNPAIDTAGAAAVARAADRAAGGLELDSDLDNPHKNPLVALEPDEEEDGEDVPLDIEAIRREYRRSNSYAPSGRSFVQKEIGVARRVLPPIKTASPFEQIDRNTPSYFGTFSVCRYGDKHIEKFDKKTLAATK
ncbi:hypothetical protein EDC01DRAFT_272437 [Geopyxis carbonaria]|nr:hypothetical protein EDC01DRAFT_272437 [Geopyxis carbonaria]